MLSAEGALELMVAKQRFLSERHFNFGYMPLSGLYVWDSPGFGLKAPAAIERVDLGDGCNSTAMFSAATPAALQNGGVAIFALARGVDLNEHGRFRVTVGVSAATAASANVGLEVELLDLGAHDAEDKLSDGLLHQGSGGLPPLFVLETDNGSNQAKIGPDFRPEAGDRFTHGRLRARRGTLLLRDLERRPLPAAFAAERGLGAGVKVTLDLDLARDVCWLNGAGRRLGGGNYAASGDVALRHAAGRAAVRS